MATRTASTWTYKEVLDIGISYDSTETELSAFMSMLGLSNIAYPREQNLIVNGIQKLWTFSFEFDSRNLINESDKQDNMRRGEEGIERVFRILKKQQNKRDVMPTTEMKR